MSQIPLFPAQKALAGLRDSGIKNTASAVSEIIDNSVDANAKNISVLILEKNQKSGKRFLDKIDEICILDDGNGMTEDILSKCLAVGGRDESDDDSENHTGRFGYGLPKMETRDSACASTHQPSDPENDSVLGNSGRDLDSQYI